MFDEYWCADYSGSASAAGQRAAIRLAGVGAAGDALISPAERFTREGLRGRLLAIVRAASGAGRRCIVGIDHQFSASSGLYEALTGEPWTAWRQLTDLLAEGQAGLPAIVEAPSSNARRWVELANARLAAKVQSVATGPFWSPADDGSRPWPARAFREAGIAPLRLVESRHPGLKPVFRVGGPGAVGLQSLCGIPHLRRLLRVARDEGIPVHAWPFDGWRPALGSHVILEIYPGLFNRGEKSHDADAWESARWIAREDHAHRLATWLEPGVSDRAAGLARLEGWVLGIPGDVA